MQNLTLPSSRARMGLLGTATALCPLAPHKVPASVQEVREHRTRCRLYGPGSAGLWGGSLAGLGCRGGPGCTLALACLSPSFPAFTLSPAWAPAEEQLKAPPGCAHREGMERRRLSFMEIIVRGPCLADGVWVPVVPGRAARLIVSGEPPAFLPAAAWPPSRCFSQRLDSLRAPGVQACSR